MQTTRGLSMLHSSSSRSRWKTSQETQAEGTSVNVLVAFFRFSLFSEFSLFFFSVET
jgi:hypothetical protein